MPGRGRPKHPDILTPREWEVLALLREHRTNDEIAQALGISFTTARFHVSQILAKLGVSSREEAARWQPATERRAWLLAPVALVRRMSGLGATARVAGGATLVLAAGATLALALGGVALLAWGVFAMRGGQSDATSQAAASPGTPGSVAVACETPSATITPGLELGSAPIFWRFEALTEQQLTSGHLCAHDFKIVVRVTNGTGACAPGQDAVPDLLQAGNVATGEHLSLSGSCVTCPGAACPGVDLPGSYFVTGGELPSAGEWRLQVRFLSDFSSQTVRIGGPDVPTLAGGPQPPCAPPQQPGGGTPMTVVLVERATGQCHVIPTADRLMQAKWVEDGKTFVAYDTDEKSFVIYDTDGNPLQAIDLKTPDDGSIGGIVSPSPDGRSILVDREIPGAGISSFAVRDVKTGQDLSFPQPDGVNGQASYSPDGQHAAYVNTNAGKESLVIATTPVTDGRFTIVKSVDASLDYIAPLDWSPDGAHLLVMTGETGGPCVGSPDPNCHLLRSQTYEVLSAAEPADTGIDVFSQDLSQNDARVTSVAWVGANRLLIAQPAVTAKDGTPLEAKATLVTLGSASTTPAPAALSNIAGFAGIDSVSPNGRSAIAGNELIDIASGRSTRLAEYDASYFTDWTADSSEVLLSFAGN